MYRKINNKFLIGYFLFIRALLHMVEGSAAYVLVLQFFEISPIIFSITVLLPFAVFSEFHQHRTKVVDSINRYILIRDTYVFVYLITGFAILYLLKDSLFSGVMPWFIVAVVAALIIFLGIAEKYKPKGDHWEWKHYFDIITWTVGLFILYPLIEKCLLS